MLSVIILSKNEEKVIALCLDSIKQIADEIILVDSFSTDKTVEIARKYGAKVYSKKFVDFASQHNFAHTKAKEEWVFFIDADERVTKELAESIKKAVSDKNKEISAYKIKRQNYYFNQVAWPTIEIFVRIFKRKDLQKWEGRLHETPIFEGKQEMLSGLLLHYTHRDFSSMVDKTNSWSQIEAELRIEANHPKMSWWRFPRVMGTAFFNSYIKQGGWKIGTPGLLESTYQAFSIFITYAKLWEMQKENSR